MLQQTQVATVIPYYARFMARFPSLSALAAAEEDDVLAVWSGLGYYSRARNLHAAARCVVDHHGGAFPTSADLIVQLPGIGRSTAAAIAALAFGHHVAILDGNVKRVLARHAGIAGWPGDPKVQDLLWQQAESRLPTTSIEAYTQGMMDLGALVCRRGQPACDVCPLSADCVAHTQRRTAELPTPRPRKTLPEKQVQMLLLVDQGELLLEKRPARGIWGGLWSLPEFDAGIDPATHCLQQFGVSARSLRPLTPLAHSFTHFKLHIQAVLLEPVSRQPALPGQQWLPLAKTASAALPAPVRKLLALLDPV
jgi:A/G-specific adenine glycosylase